jgi:hypothetical protein
MASTTDFINRYRQAITNGIQALDTLDALRREYAALSLDTRLTDADFEGNNAGITAEQLQKAVASIDAIAELMGQGHATNLYIVKQ